MRHLRVWTRFIVLFTLFTFNAPISFGSTTAAMIDFALCERFMAGTEVAPVKPGEEPGPARFWYTLVTAGPSRFLSQYLGQWRAVWEHQAATRTHETYVSEMQDLRNWAYQSAQAQRRQLLDGNDPLDRVFLQAAHNLTLTFERRMDASTNQTEIYRAVYLHELESRAIRDRSDSLRTEKAVAISLIRGLPEGDSRGTNFASLKDQGRRDIQEANSAQQVQNIVRVLSARINGAGTHEGFMTLESTPNLMNAIKEELFTDVDWPAIFGNDSSAEKHLLNRLTMDVLLRQVIYEELQALRRAGATVPHLPRENGRPILSYSPMTMRVRNLIYHIVKTPDGLDYPDVLRLYQSVNELASADRIGIILGEQNMRPLLPEVLYALFVEAMQSPTFRVILAGSTQALSTQLPTVPIVPAPPSRTPPTAPRVQKRYKQNQAEEYEQARAAVRLYEEQYAAWQRDWQNYRRLAELYHRAALPFFHWQIAEAYAALLRQQQYRESLLAYLAFYHGDVFPDSARPREILQTAQLLLTARTRALPEANVQLARRMAEQQVPRVNGTIPSDSPLDGFAPRDLYLFIYTGNPIFLSPPEAARWLFFLGLMEHPYRANATFDYGKTSTSTASPRELKAVQTATENGNGAIPIILHPDRVPTSVPTASDELVPVQNIPDAAFRPAPPIEYPALEQPKINGPGDGPTSTPDTSGGEAG